MRVADLSRASCSPPGRACAPSSPSAIPSTATRRRLQPGGNVRVEPGDGAVTVQVTRAGGRCRPAPGGAGRDATARRRSGWSIPATGSGRRDPRSQGSTQLRVRDDGTFGDHDRYQHGRHDGHHRLGGRPPGDDRRRRRTASTPAPTCVVRVPQGAGSRSISRSGAVTVDERGRRAHGGRPQRAGHRHRRPGHAQRGRGRRRRAGDPGAGRC